MTRADGQPSADGIVSNSAVACIEPETGYITNIEEIRQIEYPMLKDTTYLDHAGTTLYAKSLIDTFSKSMSTTLLGNPHSASASSQASSRLIDDTRLRVLQFFNASPDDFDVVFTANATAAIKLVAEAFRDSDGGFWYGYHADSHTSLVGVRELAEMGSRCFRDDHEVENWIGGQEKSSPGPEGGVRLFGYPGQSNMTGHRSPVNWCRRIREASTPENDAVYTMYDAAALVSNSPLNLSNAGDAPDFTALSFYKIFGFPDLGALIVRKQSADILRKRKYFGGGTVDMVTFDKDDWYAKKESALHSSLEDGTVPFHSILALSCALSVHARLYGIMNNVQQHTAFLAAKTFGALSRLRHANGEKVCHIYDSSNADDEKWHNRGSVIAFNLLDNKRDWVGKTEVEKLATIKNIQLRTGGLCNPGGIARHLELSAQEMQNSYVCGQRCGDDFDLINGRPVGAIRISFGAMSSLADVENFLSFIEEFYVDRTVPQASTASPAGALPPPIKSGFFVQALSIFPIKSCSAYRIPAEQKWEVRPAGLAYDREWCLVHQGTGSALSQKRYPKMALLLPKIDLKRNLLRITYSTDDGLLKTLELRLDASLDRRQTANTCTDRNSNVCGDKVTVQVYDSLEVSDFFTSALDVPCTLARCPASPGNRVRRPRRPLMDISNRVAHDLVQPSSPGKSILLSNESPILIVSRSSVNRLNEQIKASSTIGQAVAADSFRGNIIVAEHTDGLRGESPYIEETWQRLRIGERTFEVMGPCQRCQMVCVDQGSGGRRGGGEPFVTLAKTRRREGKVWFGVHAALAKEKLNNEEEGARCWIGVGDGVEAF